MNSTPTLGNRTELIRKAANMEPTAKPAPSRPPRKRQRSNMLKVVKSMAHIRILNQGYKR